MPLCVTHPIALAALAVLAIGLISYNIITNKKKKIPIRQRRIEYVDDYKTEVKSHDHPGVRKRRKASTDIKTPSGKTESKKQDDTREETRNESRTCSSQTHPDFSRGSSVEKEVLFNNLDSLNQNRDENSKILNIQNINQEDLEKVDITKTVDEDAQSSVSNVSATDTNDLDGETSSLEYQKSKGNSEENISEKLYKKEVCESLRNEVETMTLSSHADSHLSENDDGDDMCNLRDLDNAGEKPVICKGCEESYANAVAYPCGHRYLCLDCAIKVHRIYQKCSVCNFHIETYDIFNSRET